MTFSQRDFIVKKFPEIFKTKSKSDIFEILNALFFLIKTGCQWKLRPNDFPKWHTIYEFYRKWISTGFFDRLTREFNDVARVSNEKQTPPTVAVIDSIIIASANRHASASACFGYNATALLPHCTNTSARRLTAPALTNIGERGLGTPRQRD